MNIVKLSNTDHYYFIVRVGFLVLQVLWFPSISRSTPTLDLVFTEDRLTIYKLYVFYHDLIMRNMIQIKYSF